MVCVVLLVLLTILRVSRTWQDDAYLIHTSGTWTALADDLKNGVFYRPLYGELGYGGTRYFPLHFMLHAALLKLGAEPRLAGYGIELVSMLGLLSVVFLLLRSLGADRLSAACGAALVLSIRAAQIGLMSIRGDPLSAALNVGGLAVCTRTSFSGRHLWGASLLFTLAFFAKPTTLFGLAAVFFCFLFTGRSRQAWKLLALTAAGFLVVLGGMQLASGGRVFEIMRACAYGGGRLRDILSGPFRVGLVTLDEEPGSAAFLVLGLAAFAAQPGRRKLEIPPLLLLATALATTFILSSPGTFGNHLLDLHIAALVMFVAALFQNKEKTEFGLSALGFAALLALVPLKKDYINWDGFQRRNAWTKELQLIAQDRRPILAENPLLPILAGQRPYVIDPFMFRVLRQRDPSFAEPMWVAIRNRSFSAIVLVVDPHSEFGKTWYTNTHFGEGFIPLVESNYQLVARTEEAFVYFPRGSP